jgi:histidinol phosphatase-like enzyme
MSLKLQGLIKRLCVIAQFYILKAFKTPQYFCTYRKPTKILLLY